MDVDLPEHWSHANPVDILGDAGPERYAKAIEVASKTRTATACWSSSRPRT
ncbi:MAG: hypothetical protein R3A10_09250 [Caldilineaceae bacterium]